MRIAPRLAFAFLFLYAAPAFGQQPDVLTRGPIHEAFAQPLDVTGGPTMALPKAPPPPIRELPPDQQPEGANVQWIPGYWGWDADKSDFIWVSGVYRDAPPGRQFVPGYWTNTPEGWRWVAGFWAADQQTDPPTVPQPPESLESGPASPQPDENSMYAPGTWVYQNSAFAWRPGYWTAFRPNLLWIPPHYVWTPAGWVYIDGYWDLPLANRGLLFAPVAFVGSPWLDPGWSYTPSCVVRPSVILGASFFRPRTGHFFFGNFFGPGHATLGFRPWFTGLGRFDPAFSHFVWTHRSTPNWFAGYRQSFQAGRLAGPVVVPISQFARQSGGVTIVHANTVNRQVQIQRSQQLVQARRQRDLAVARTVSAPTIARAPATIAATKTTLAKVYTPARNGPVYHAPAAATPHQTVRPAPSHPVQHAAVQHAAVQHAAAQHAAVQHAAVQHAAVQHAAVQHVAVQHVAAHTARAAPVQHKPARAAPVHHAAPAHAAPAHHAAQAHTAAKSGGSHHH
jgi:WXXGXW repeat (2 copies)